MRSKVFAVYSSKFSFFHFLSFLWAKRTVPQKIVDVFANAEISFTRLPWFIHRLGHFKINGSEQFVRLICELLNNTSLLVFTPDDLVNIC